MFRGSIPGHALGLDRNRENGHLPLFSNYFHRTNPLFPVKYFQHRFQKARPLFNRILEGVTVYDDYFKFKDDALGRVGFTSYKKCTVAVWMLAYGVSGDLFDEH